MPLGFKVVILGGRYLKAYSSMCVLKSVGDIFNQCQPCEQWTVNSFPCWSRCRSCRCTTLTDVTICTCSCNVSTGHVSVQRFVSCHWLECVHLFCVVLSVSALCEWPCISFVRSKQTYIHCLLLIWWVCVSADQTWLSHKCPPTSALAASRRFLSTTGV